MEFIYEAGKKLPVVGEYDVLVCGGGTSGIPAALSAARQGTSVGVLERNGYLGGVPATNINPTWHGKARVRSDLIDEFMSLALNAGNLPEHNQEIPQIDSETIKYISQELLIESGVDIHFYQYISAIVQDAKTITGIITESISGRRVFLGKRIIDATGGALVAKMAGAEYFEGDPEGRIQGMTLRVRYGNINIPRFLDWVENHNHYFRNITPKKLHVIRERNRHNLDFHLSGDLKGFFKLHPEIEFLPHESYFTCAKLFPGELNCNATRIDGQNPNKVEDITKAEITCRRQTFALLTLLQKHVPGFEDARLIETAPEVGIRESRCIKGDYVLTYQDCITGKKFPDSICMNQEINFDLHDPHHYSCLPSKTTVTIPYRCLLPAGIENILVVGRGVSADHRANSGIRQMRTVFILGEAAGIAAALSVQFGVTPRELPYTSLKPELLKGGIGI